MATFHADKSQTDHTDDITMPKTTGRMYPHEVTNFVGGKKYETMTAGTNTDIREDEMGYPDPITFWRTTNFQFQSWGPYIGMKNGDKR